MSYLLAIDQGTTSSRAMVFDLSMRPVSMAQKEITQIYPAPGWVEHDPMEIWHSVLDTARQALAAAGLGPADIAGIGITNQRETTVLWDRDSGKPVHNAIVWQDRRTADHCDALRIAGHEEMVSDLTGLLLDPYFSASKLAWLRAHLAPAPDARLAFGTIDSWLLWKLTGGRVHATDATNAARTLLFDIHKGGWSDALCDLFDIPQGWLPEVRDCAAEFGQTDPALFGAAIPIRGMAGDQHAASMGQACFQPGMIKATYGTGCFALLNTGTKAVRSSSRLLTTVASQFDGTRTYALEGAIFNAGTVVQWLRDGLGLIATAAEVDALARAADPALDVLLVPAFTGLGAPYWRPDARGAVFGLTRNSGRAELARAALDSVAYQTRDLWEAMRRDWQGQAQATALRVDGGMCASDLAMQGLADMIGAPVDRPVIQETTALGAAWLAGMQAGVWPDAEGFARAWALERQFTPSLDSATRDARYARWQRAVHALLQV